MPCSGPCHVLCVGYSEIFLLGNPGVLSAAKFCGLGQELDLLPVLPTTLPLESHTWVAARAGMLLCLPGHACSTIGMRTCTLSGSRQSLVCLSSSTELQSQGDVSGSAVAQAARAFLSELARDTGMPGCRYFHLWHVLTLIQLAST